MGMGDGSLGGERFFRVRPEEFFEAAAGREGDREGKGRLLLFFRARSWTYARPFPISLFPSLASPAVSLLAASPRSSTTRHMDAHEERLLRRTRKRPRESSSRFASLVKRTRETLHTAQRADSPSLPPRCLPEYVTPSVFFQSLSRDAYRSSGSDERT